jgi:hypothetical protein
MSSKTPDPSDTKIDLHQAVSAAQQFLNELYPSKIDNVLLEEVEERGGEWLITFGFDTHRNIHESLTGILLSLPKRQEMTRGFKTFIVDSESGKVRAMKIHPNAVSA